MIKLTVFSIIVVGLSLASSQGAFAAPVMAAGNSCEVELAKLKDYYATSLDLSTEELSLMKARRIRTVDALRQIRDMISKTKKDPKAAIDEAFTIDFRGAFFRLESRFKVLKGTGLFERPQYAKFKGVFDEAYAVVTDAENVLGAYSDTLDNIKKINKISKASVPDDVKEEVAYLVDYFPKANLEAKDKLVDYLHTTGWLQSDVSFNKVIDAFKVLNMMSKKLDRKLLVKGLADYAKKIDKEIGVLARMRKPLNDLEGQVHPPRRWLRWLSLDMLAANSFELKDGPSPIKELQDLVLDPETDGKYANLSITGVEKDPIYLNRHVFEGIVYYIGVLGNAKEVGQFKEFVKTALLTKEGMTEEEAEEKAKKITTLLPKYVDTFPVAKKALKEIYKMGLIKELRKEIKKGKI